MLLVVIHNRNPYSPTGFSVGMGAYVRSSRERRLHTHVADAFVASACDVSVTRAPRSSFPNFRVNAALYMLLAACAEVPWCPRPSFARYCSSYLVDVEVASLTNLCDAYVREIRASRS